MQIHHFQLYYTKFFYQPPLLMPSEFLRRHFFNFLLHISMMLRLLTMIYNQSWCILEWMITYCLSASMSAASVWCLDHFLFSSLVFGDWHIFKNSTHNMFADGIAVTTEFTSDRTSNHFPCWVLYLAPLIPGWTMWIPGGFHLDPLPAKNPFLLSPGSKKFHVDSMWNSG